MPSPLKLVSRFPDGVKRATKKSYGDPVLPATTILPFASIAMARMASHPPPRWAVHLPSLLNDVSSVPSVLRRASATSAEEPTPTQPPTTIFPSSWMAPALQSSSFHVLNATWKRPLALLVDMVTVAGSQPVELNPVVSRLPSAFRTATTQS